MNKEEKRKCQSCNKTMPKIGDQRKNGKALLHDWNSRKMCKKCYFAEKERRMYESMREHYFLRYPDEKLFII